jgi:hypothetical protein
LNIAVELELELVLFVLVLVLVLELEPLERRIARLTLLRPDGALVPCGKVSVSDLFGPAVLTSASVYVSAADPSKMA